MQLIRSNKLTSLIVLATILSFGHTTDHLIRGDFRWSLTLDSVVFIMINLVIYSVSAVGLYLYSKGKVGPGFWAIVGGLGLAFGWLAHFSPYTDQPPEYILGAYESVSAGWLALSCLIGLMSVLTVATVYAGYLRTRGLRG